MEEITGTLSVRNCALCLWRLARYWSYNWASLAAKTCSRLKQGWCVKINPEISMSSWKFPGGSPDPIKCWLLWMYFTACQREQSVGGTQLKHFLDTDLMCNRKSQMQNISYANQARRTLLHSLFPGVLGACPFLNTWKVKWGTRSEKRNHFNLAFLGLLGFISTES